MVIGESFVVFNWFLLHFVENNGFAFGYEFFGVVGKFLLTIFRIFFAGFIFVWLLDLLKNKKHKLVCFGLSLVFAGAVGNIIDSIFYGVIYGYAPLFFGRVVDMFYFPLFVGYYPDWIPFFGGDKFIFFRYIFNVADSSITVGAFILLFFHREISFK